nr:glycosyltransferase [uncultured Bdellovibrio sp.]
MISLLPIVKMESSVSTPHCSFVIYLDKDAAIVGPFLQDLRSFFQKFPLHYELVAVIEKGASDCVRLLEQAQKESGERERLTLVPNASHLGRAESLRQGLNKASGNYLVLADPVTATPLGDLFKILQNLMSEPTLDVCWGQRLSKKDSPFLNSNSRRHHLERFFNGILQEREKHVSDPLCEIGGLKKEAWLRVKDFPAPLKGWYLHPQLQKQIAKAGLKKIEIPIYDSGKTSASYSYWRERWHLLRQSIF